MTRLLCGCESSFGDWRCQAEATQEDLLCDECRKARGADSSLNGVIYFVETGRHEHVEISQMKFGTVDIRRVSDLPAPPFVVRSTT